MSAQTQTAPTKTKPDPRRHFSCCDGTKGMCGTPINENTHNRRAPWCVLCKSIMDKDMGCALCNEHAPEEDDAEDE